MICIHPYTLNGREFPGYQWLLKDEQRVPARRMYRTMRQTFGLTRQEARNAMLAVAAQSALHEALVRFQP